MSEQRWKIEYATVSEDGLSIEIKFKTIQPSISQHTLNTTADVIFHGLLAEFQLARFREALTEATDILQGRA